MEMIKKGSAKKIVIVEKGKPVEKRSCPKTKTKKCLNCKPFCHITTGFSGAGAFSDGKLSLSTEVGGSLPELIGEELAQETIWYTDGIYLEFGADEKIEGVGAATSEKLMRHFETIDAMRAATLEQLEAVPGVSKKVAARLYSHFRNE
jgi:uncharacterized FAD-dependent dehydrogenase